MKIYTDRNWVIVKDKKKPPNVRANNVYYMLCVFTVAMQVLFFGSMNSP